MDITHIRPADFVESNNEAKVEAFLLAVVSAATVAVLILLFAVDREVPNPASASGAVQTVHAASRLTSPSVIHHAKPSPLHPATLQASVR